MKNWTLIKILFIAFLGCSTVYAQDKTIIRGRVVDSSDKTTIIGANVVEYDKENRVINGTITDISGDFVLTMKDPNNIVKVSVIGYVVRQIEVDPSKSVIIEMTSDALTIEEVRVVGVSRTSSSLTNLADRDKAGASVKVDMSDMKDAGITSAADALQGKISGLDIISASGDPGAGSQLVIRGLSSMGNNQPLIVVDGVPQFKIERGSIDLASADSEDISNLVNIALQDIKSIEVLKDAASTAIYGSRGADGVLLIETHKGRKGKVRFDFQYKSNWSVQPDAIPMLNGDEYIMLQLEEWHNAYGVFPLDQEIAYDKDYNQFYNYSANTDWLKEITQNGQSNDYYFSVSGGGEKARYFTSFGYLDESGTTINTGYTRFSSRINLDYNLSKKLLFQIKFNYTSSDRQRNVELQGSYWQPRNIREMAYIKSPNMSVYEYDAQGNPTGEYFTPIQSYQGDGVTYFNPVAVANLGSLDEDFTKLENTFMLQYRVNDWIRMHGTVSFQYAGTQDKRFLPYNAIGADWLNWQVNKAGEGNNLNQSIQTELQIAFNSPFKNPEHQLSGALTWGTNASSFEWMFIESAKTPSTDLKDPAVNASINWIGNGSGENRLLSGLSNINYKYKDRYLIQTNLRADAHSSFGSNNRWGLFYGIFVGWRFSEEAIFENLEWLNESMIRASYGVSGRQPNDVYARYATYESTRTGSYIFSPAIAPTSVQLNNLRWETISSWDVGAEFNLFKDRLYIEGDVYGKTSTDILFPYYEIPLSSGFDQLKYLNGGEMTNKGWEIMADYKAVRKKDWFLSFNFNISHNQNSFNKLPENFNSERSTSIGNGQYPLRVVEGEPIGSFFGFRYLGVYASDDDVVARDAEGNVLYDAYGMATPMKYTDAYIFKGGDPIYEDINHDGKIDINDAVYIGDSNPDFIGGLGTNLNYKNWSFGMSFHYRIGFDIINGIALQTQGMNNKDNQSKAVLKRWRMQGQSEEGLLPKAYMYHPANNLGSDRYVEKGDYFRLNNIKLSYSLSSKVVQKLHLSKAYIAVSARKLFTWTGYTGQDPEIGQNASNPFWIGVDNARTPPSKIFTLSIGVGF